MKKIKSLFAVLTVIAIILTQTAFVVSADSSYTLGYSLAGNETEGYTLTLESLTQADGVTEPYDVVVPDTAGYDIDGNGTIEANESGIPVTKIDANAFVGNKDNKSTLVQSITIGSKVQTMGDGTSAYVFRYLPKMTELTIPDNVTSLSGRQIAELSNVTEITLGKGLETVTYYCIYKCKSLEKINVTSETFKFHLDGFYLNNPDGAIIDITACKDITITGLLRNAEGVKFVVSNGNVYNKLIAAGYTDADIDYNMADGTEITVSSVDGKYALKYTVSGKNVTVNGFDTNPEETVDLVIPSKVTDPVTGLTFTVNAAAQSAFGSTNIKSVVLPGTIETMGTRLFQNCDSLVDVELQEGITSLNFYMFYDCRELSKLIIPASVTSIDLKSMQAAHQLKTVVILGEDVKFTNKVLSGKEVGGTVFYVKNDTVKAAIDATGSDATYFNKAEVLGNETGVPSLSYAENVVTLTVPSYINSYSVLVSQFADENHTKLESVKVYSDTAVVPGTYNFDVTPVEGKYYKVFIFNSLKGAMPLNSTIEF